MTRERRALYVLIGFILALLVALGIAMSNGGDGDSTFLVILGAPWSLFVAVLIDLLSSRIGDHISPLIGIVGGLINAPLIYWWLRRDRRDSVRRSGTEL